MHQPHLMGLMLLAVTMAVSIDICASNYITLFDTMSTLFLLQYVSYFSMLNVLNIIMHYFPTPE